MRRSLLALALLLCGAAPAAATEWLVCSGEGADISLLLGQLPVAAVTRANFSVGDDTWSTHPDIEPGTLVTLGQAFDSPTMMLVDLTDEAMGAVVAELRLFKAAEGEDIVSGGTLRVAGRGAWAVSCSGP